MTPYDKRLVKDMQRAIDKDIMPPQARSALRRAVKRLQALAPMVARARELEAHLNTPELHDFAKGVISEAQHQRARWGAEHDAGKAPADWFWLVGYLAGKALHAAVAGHMERALHHTISTSAVLANWHAALSGASNTMRPGIDPAKAEGAEAS